MLTENNGISHVASNRSVNDVLAQLLTLLQTKGITVFAVVDHSGEAAKVGLEMHDTKLVIFGKLSSSMLELEVLDTWRPNLRWPSEQAFMQQSHPTRLPSCEDLVPSRSTI